MARKPRGPEDSARRLRESPKTKPLPEPVGVQDLAAFLRGGWLLSRVIEDHRRRVSGALEGRADFTDVETAGLLYREQGRLVLDGKTSEVFQSYRYDFPSPYLALVSFADGRPFHRLDLRNGEDRPTHHCQDDTYQGLFRAVSEDLLRIIWRVSGPRKELYLDSRLRRLR